MINRESRVLAAFRRYFVAGGLAAVIDVGCFSLLAKIMAAVPAAIIAFSIAAVFNYVVSSLAVFHTRLTLGRFVTFYASALLGMAVNVSITIALLQYATPLPWLAKLGGVAVAFFFNFFINYAVIFARWQPKT